MNNRVVYFNPEMNAAMDRLPSVKLFPVAQRCVVPASSQMCRYHVALVKAEEFAAMTSLQNTRLRAQLKASDEKLLEVLDRKTALRVRLHHAQDSAWVALVGKVKRWLRGLLHVGGLPSTLD